MYCCCGVKKTSRKGKWTWKCKCKWKGWNLCYPRESIPKSVPIKKIPDKNGVYEVRTFDEGDDFEEESEFSILKKNWGEVTNQAISHWKIEYDDNWTGYRGVYAWKEKDKK